MTLSRSDLGDPDFEAVLLDILARVVLPERPGGGRLIASHHFALGDPPPVEGARTPEPRAGG